MTDKSSLLQQPSFRRLAGRAPYGDTVAAMQTHAAAIRDGSADEEVWLVEHDPVLTGGTSANAADLINPGGIPVHETGRGGQWTYHGPGQRVAYVMLDLQRRQPDVRAYVYALDTLGAELYVGTGIMPVTQPDASLAALQDAIATHDDWQLGMLHRAVTLGGSLVLGLAMLRGEMDADALFDTAFLDELWQSEKWGSDWEAEDRRALIRGEIGQAHRFLALVAGEAA